MDDFLYFINKNNNKSNLEYIYLELEPIIYDRQEKNDDENHQLIKDVLESSKIF